MTYPIVPEKFCVRCEQTKPASEFHRDKWNTTGLVAYCKPCVSAKMQKVYAERKDEIRDIQKSYSQSRAGQRRTFRTYQRDQIKRELKRKGLKGARYVPARILELEEYEMMVEAQGGRCALCGDEQKGQRLSIDHDHATGKIRALLCVRCNMGLGQFRDSPTLLEQARLYLLSHSQ